MWTVFEARKAEKHIDRLPKHVLENLGQPFNYAHKTPHGFGLGLAWVTTICRKYGWELIFSNRSGGIGFCAMIQFPKQT